MTTSMATCSICYEELDAAKAFTNLCGPECTDLVCGECLGGHVKSLSAGAFSGAATVMKCPFHVKHVMPFSRWKHAADDAIVAAQNRRARATLSLQCGACHTR